MRDGTVARAVHSSLRRGHSVGIHVTFSRIRLSRRGGAVAEEAAARRWREITDVRRMLMNGTKVLALAAVGALFVVVAPLQRAQALSLINPGAAAAVQQDSKDLTTEVRWGWHRHHHWHHHHRWHWRRWHHHRHW